MTTKVNQQHRIKTQLRAMIEALSWWATVESTCTPDSGSGPAYCWHPDFRVVDSREVSPSAPRPLRDLDEVAYLRFASVYRSFDSLADFEREVEALWSPRAFAVGRFLGFWRIGTRGRCRADKGAVEMARDSVTQSASGQPAGKSRLPLRWAFIIAVSTAVGLGIGIIGGLVPGITIGMALAGLLHEVLA